MKNIHLSAFDKKGYISLNKIVDIAFFKERRELGLQRKPINGDPELGPKVDKALVKDDYLALEELIESGARIDFNNDLRFSRHSPLTFAIKRNAIKCVLMMLEYGLDLNNEKINPLIYAAKHGGDRSVITRASKVPYTNVTIRLNCRTAIIRALIVLGEFDVNTQCYDTGETCLHIATQTCQLDLVEALLELGADPTIPDNGGNKPCNIEYFLEKFKDAKASDKKIYGNSEEQKNKEKYRAVAKLESELSLGLLPPL